MIDYTYPSVYFAYLFFTLSVLLCLFFLVRSWKDGYWGKDGEEVKYQIFDEEDRHGTKQARPQELR